MGDEVERRTAYLLFTAEDIPEYFTECKYFHSLLRLGIFVAEEIQRGAILLYIGKSCLRLVKTVIGVIVVYHTYLAKQTLTKTLFCPEGVVLTG
jgi:hypothetical protein